MKHTPGPWQKLEHDHKPIQILAHVENSEFPTWDNKVVCFVGSNDTCQDTDQANAHLIAAAPEMLATLEHINEFIDHEKYPVVADMIVSIIKKARGES